MAQLLKIEDCVSRYEQDVYRYTGQYIRLKSDRWKRVKANWENEKLSAQVEQPPSSEDEPTNKKWWQRKDDNSEKDAMDTYDRPRTPITLPALKKNFKDELLEFQLKWASSTIRERSRVGKEILSDPFLRYLLMDLPDNYLVLYKPIIQMKKAEAQLDVLLIGPDTIHAIVLLDARKGDVVHPSQGRFWELERKGEMLKTISPIASIQRMNYFIESVIDTKETEMKISYTILAQQSFINRGSIPPYIQVIDQTSYDQWAQAIKRQPSPIKAKQLKAAKQIMEKCVTTAYLRPEWETEQDLWVQIDSE